MLHLFKYRFLQIIRDYSAMFWALAFPIILGTLFYLSFGHVGLEATGDSAWDVIKVAVLREDTSSENARAFESYLAMMEEEMLDIQDISKETEALDALNEEEIAGIYYIREEPSFVCFGFGFSRQSFSV